MRTINIDFNAKKIFASYDVTMNLSYMASLCPYAMVFDKILLLDYRLEFRGYPNGKVLATIESQTERKVPVTLWEITIWDEEELDHYYDFPRLYNKKIIDNDYSDREIMTYILKVDRPFRVPDERYTKKILEGYLSSGFDRTYIEDAISLSKLENKAKL